MSKIDTFLKVCFNISFFLNQKQRIIAIYIFFLTLISFFLEGSVLLLLIPIVQIILDKDYIIGDNLLKLINFFHRVDLSNLSNIKIYLISAFLIIVILGIFARFLLLSFNLSLAKKINEDFSSRLYNYYTNLDYEHLKRINTSYIIDVLTVKLERFSGFVFYTITILSNSIIAMCLLIIFCIKMSAFLLLGISLLIIIYYSVIKFSKNKIYYFSKVLDKNTFQRTNILKETINYNLDIKQDKSYFFFKNQYYNYNKSINDLNYEYTLIANVPRFALELQFVIFSIAIAYFQSAVLNDNISSSINNLVFVMYCMFRLLPITQIIYNSFNEIKLYKPSFDSVYNLLLKNFRKNVKTPMQMDQLSTNKIKFLNVNFYYDEDLKKKLILNNINLEIELGKVYYLDGASGSGKSTFLNLLSNLYYPKSGEIYYDKSCEENITYVAQDIYILNNTVKKNIYIFDKSSYGDIKNSIVVAAKKACIAEFIDKLDNKYDSIISEDGKNFSGGQKQRIGLARAFHRNKDILILDEATNSIDEEVEKKIIKNILSNKKNNQTIFISSHTKSIKNYCDRILIFKNKNIILKNN
jgi:ABC-type multidrug transport system fused ATPase/permease subunit